MPKKPAIPHYRCRCCGHEWSFDGPVFACPNLSCVRADKGLGPDISWRNYVEMHGDRGATAGSVFARSHSVSPAPT